MIKKELPLNIDFGILILRMFIGFRLLYGVIDNLLSWHKMIEFSVFLESFNFPFPVVSAVASVYLQFFAAISLLVGFKMRVFAGILIINFVIALLFVHLRVKDSIEVMTPALAILFSSMTLIFTGAGKYSLDNYWPEHLKNRKTTLGVTDI